MKWPLWNICVTNDHGYVPLVVNTSRSFPHSWLITEFVTRLTRRVPLVEQELCTLPEHLNHSRGARVTRSLALCVCFVNRCLSFCTFFFWPLSCLSFFDLWILLTPLVSLNSSGKRWFNPIFFDVRGRPFNFFHVLKRNNLIIVACELNF